MVEWSLGDPLSEFCPTTRLPAKMSAITKNRKFGKKSLKLLGQMDPNYGEMVFRWSPFRIISDNPTCQIRWWPLLKIED
jgi:hypothetical protein